MSGLLSGKKGIIFGVSNKRGIAYAIAKALHSQGAEVAFTYFGDAMRDRVTPLAQDMGAKLILDCDASNIEQVDSVYKKFEETYGKMDFLIHAVAFANKDDLKGDFSDVSIDGWNLALGVSAHSLVSLVNRAKPILNDSASIITLSYIGGETVIPNYNVMGVAKSALESSVRYLAAELGEKGIRVNAISAGPIKTLAAKGIGGFEKILRVTGKRAPLKRNVTLEEVGNSGLFLVSDWSTGITGEVLHVDCGFHAVGADFAESE